MRHARRRKRPRVVFAVAALVAAAVFVQLTGPVCASPDRRGRAYFYEARTPGNCSLPRHGMLFASVSTAEYAGSAACGGYLDVTGPTGTVRVLVVDRCPACGPGDLDLSAEAFVSIADRGDGSAAIAYREVRDPEPARRLAFRVKPGSTVHWAALQVLDHGNRLAHVRVRSGPHWRDLRRGADNYWVFPAAPGPGPYTVRVSDVNGGEATVTGVRLRPGATQRFSQRLYGTPPPIVRAITTPSDKASPEMPEIC
ncbi:expansin EXLX1 family cellulose-binding protein [Herbidospora yilanensis]|uniref:expansin EXLX1 family cellulose-binding protein n=1 Tax=Herbidospora yilanensis TaxID=354426 RepID=UPI0012F8D052|nr:expansin EXLX1 family cellulose-binding protein [Herbidospora yilanensis]